LVVLVAMFFFATHHVLPLDVADQFVKAHREEWQLQPYHELRGSLLLSPEIGTKVKYSVYQDGVLILGLDIEVDVGSDLKVQAFQNNYRPVVHIDFQKNRYLTAEQVAGKASVEKMLYVNSVSAIPELVYFIRMDEVWKGMFRARDGKMLGKIREPVLPAPIAASEGPISTR
jgi:hypothetical protein